MTLPATVDHEDLKISYLLRAECTNKRTTLQSAISWETVTIIRAPALAPLLEQTPITLSNRWVDGTRIGISIERRSAPLNGSLPMVVSARSRDFIDGSSIRIHISEVVERFCRFESNFQSQPWLTSRLCHITQGPKSLNAIPVMNDAQPRHKILMEETQEDSCKASKHYIPVYLENSLKLAFWSTEMELNVRLPSCLRHANVKKTRSMNFDVREKRLQISHLLEVQ